MAKCKCCGQEKRKGSDSWKEKAWKEVTRCGYDGMEPPAGLVAAYQDEIKIYEKDEPKDLGW